MTVGTGSRRSSSRIAEKVERSSGIERKTVAQTSNKKRSPPKTEAQTSNKKRSPPKTEAPTEPKKSKSTASHLSVGDSLPKLTLQNDQGEDVNISALRSSVIFTYPKANTGGCTKQACLYRDEYSKWQDAGFQVFGLSNDGITSLKNWKTKQLFPYALLSDPKREFIGSLTGSKTSTPRSHFVVDKEGKLALSSVGVKPAESSPDALQFVATLK